MGRAKNRTIQQILITGWLVLSLILGIIAFRQFVLPLIGAQPSETLPSDLNPPYMRLVKSSMTVGNDETAVDIKINTAERETIEADIVLEYNPKVLSTKPEGIKLYGQYAVVQITKVGDGIINLALFSNPKRSEPTLKTAVNEEVRIATIIFNIIDSQVDLTQLEFKFSPGETDESNLIPVFEVRPETPTDILQTAEGILLSL